MLFRAIRFSFLLLWAWLLCGIGLCQDPRPSADPSPPEQAAKSAKPTDSEYVIGAEDVLAVNVWKEPDMSRVVPVRPDGKITLPLIGDIQASGVSPKVLQGNIENGLKAFVAAPEVTVIVQEVKSVKFNIVGEIARPGSYPLTSSMTVLDAIAVGGGLRDFAKASHIYVLRNASDGTHAKLPFNYKQVISGKDLAQNVDLRSGDTIVVP